MSLYKLKTNQRSNPYETLLFLRNHNTLNSTIQKHGDFDTHNRENIKHIIILSCDILIVLDNMMVQGSTVEHN